MDTTLGGIDADLVEHPPMLRWKILAGVNGGNVLPTGPVAVEEERTLGLVVGPAVRIDRTTRTASERKERSARHASVD